MGRDGTHGVFYQMIFGTISVSPKGYLDGLGFSSFANISITASVAAFLYKVAEGNWGQFHITDGGWV